MEQFVRYQNTAKKPINIAYGSFKFLMGSNTLCYNITFGNY